MKRRTTGKLLASLLCLAMALGLATAALAEEDAVKHSSYMSTTGTVVSITPLVDADGKEIEGSAFVLVETQREQGTAQTNFVVDTETLRLNDNELKVGATLTGWYDGRLPMILIYPPQPKAVAIAVDAEEPPFIKLDSFDADLVSADGSLKLNLSDETVITLADGTAYEGELAGCDLAVFYAASTRSIPAQTTPSKVIVLNLPAEAPTPGEPEPEVQYPSAESVAAASIVVENEILTGAPAAYLNEDGVVMVPLRAIAEALGYEVLWDAETAGVSLGAAITLSIGRDYYTYQRVAPIELGTAPALVNGTTYVPLSFFTEVAQLNNAYFFEGQLVIDNGEKMN